MPSTIALVRDAGALEPGAARWCVCGSGADDEERRRQLPRRARATRDRAGATHCVRTG
jgi:hypothetical protein